MAGRLMLGVVSAWVAGSDPKPRHSPAAARSYLAGVIVGDRLTTRLGIVTAPSDLEVDAVSATSIVADGTPWDPVAFRSGVDAVAATDGTLAGLLKLGGRELPAHQVALVQRQIGVPFFGNLVAGK